MSEKYTDLTEEIWRSDEGRTSLGSVNMVLDYLDRRPDQVPGRTITESDMLEAFGKVYAAWAISRLARIGYTVVPDPEPTNAEQIIELMGMAPASMNRRELAKWLDAQGVKAPGAGE